MLATDPESDHVHRRSSQTIHRKQYRVNPDGHGSISPTCPVNRADGPNNKTTAVIGRTVEAVNNIVRL